MRTTGGASMTRTIFRTGLAFLILTALVGCLGNSDSDEYGEDVDSFEASSSSDTYRARVLNGELDSAFVWLDMDGDGRFSSYDEDDYRADFEESEDGALLIPSAGLPIPEPWAVTDPRGDVVIDISDFDLPEPGRRIEVDRGNEADLARARRPFPPMPPRFAG